MRWKHIRRAIVAYAVLGVSYCFAAIPLRFMYVLGGALGYLAYGVARRERLRTICHLNEFYKGSRSPREIRRLARGVFRHFGYAAMEFLALRAPKKFFERLSISVEGIEYARKALEKGSGLVWVSGHFGNWELIGSYLAHHGFPINVVARKIRQPILQEFVDKHRRGANLRVHYTKEDGVLDMMRTLKRGEVLAMLIDIRTEGDGRWVEFLGRPAYTLVGPAALAARTGAGLAFAYGVRLRPWEYRFVIHPPVEIDPPAARSGPEWEAYVMTLLQSLNNRLSAVIEQFPEQWMWMHRRHDPVRSIRRDYQENE
ncbi:MAG: lysophospholipid acyltransferase family protein [bacterium]